MQQEKQTRQAGEDVSITGSQSGQLSYSELIRYTRKLYKLSPEYVARLYGQIAGRPVTGRHILRMEQTDSFFPKNPHRRWVLARLLNVPPALLALVGLQEQGGESSRVEIPRPPKQVSVEAYYARLQSYWIDGYADGIERAVDDIKGRIDRLHDVLPYTRQKRQIASLLSGYQIILAEIAEGLQCCKAAKEYYTNAVILAEEYGCREMLGIALWRRQGFFDESVGDFSSALADFDRVRKLEYFASPLLQGLVFATAAMSQATVAHSQREQSVALSYLDAAEKCAGQPEMDNFLFFAAFDRERYFLDRASVFMNPADKKLRSPDKAQDCLMEAERQRRIEGKGICTYRQAHSDFLQAKIYYDKGYEPLAATTAESVLHTLQGYGFIPPFYVKNITALLQDLKQRAPHEEFVVSLELELLKWQQPHLFR